MRISQALVIVGALAGAACGRKEEEARAPAGDTAGQMGGMQMAMQGLQMMPQMRAHLDSLGAMPAAAAERMALNKKYLGTRTVVAGHTFLSDTPTIYPGYINVDLGAGYGQYLGALSTEDNTVVRSDGKKFNINA